jgi:putative ABC transport system substrate-binding protein
MTIGSEPRVVRSEIKQHRMAVPILLFTCLLSLVFLPTALLAAEQPKRLFRIGYLSPTDPVTESIRSGAFRQGLRDLGYVEGKNFVIQYRYLEGKVDQAPHLVAELMQLNVDMLLVQVLPGILAAKQATSTIPIVMVASVDPVATGIVDSFARPGGNITGLATLGRDLSGKRLELLKQAVPRLSRVGVLWTDAPAAAISFKEYEAAAPGLKIPLLSLKVRVPSLDFNEAFQAAAKGRVSALIAVSAGALNRHSKRIADLAIQNRLPLMCEGSVYVETGCLIFYGANDADQYRRAAVYVDKILKGARPGDLPVEQPTKFELVINLKTAKQIGLTIPPNVLARADRVIR